MQSSLIKQLLLAAESGDPAAQFNLGVLCDNRSDDNGYPIEGNREEAMKWLLAAAEQGLPRAQGRLAEMYADGPDVPCNHISACSWFLVAAARSGGIHRHRARSGYDRVSSHLTPAQLAKAARFAGNWKASCGTKPGKAKRRRRPSWERTPSEAPTETVASKPRSCTGRVFS
jgi:TPR repeat protein